MRLIITDEMQKNQSLVPLVTRVNRLLENKLEHPEHDFRSVIQALLSLVYGDRPNRTLNMLIQRILHSIGEVFKEQDDVYQADVVLGVARLTVEKAVEIMKICPGPSKEERRIQSEKLPPALLLDHLTGITRLMMALVRRPLARTKLRAIHTESPSELHQALLGYADEAIHARTHPTEDGELRAALRGERERIVAAVFDDIDNDVARVLTQFHREEYVLWRRLRNAGLEV